jgi:ankyrin repeat protein
LVPVGSAIHQEFVRAAAEGQHTARLRYLLAQGADIDSWDYDGLTSLHYAACRGDLENVRLLLSSGADVNSQHHDSGTPLSIAALKGHADVVEALLSHNARLDEGGGVMGSAIHCACFSGNIAIVKSLLDRGATLDRKVVLNIWALSERAKKRDASAPVQAIASSLKRESLEHRTVSCSPILLLADRCHFELLSLCWKGYKTQPPCSPNDTWSVLKQYELFGYPKPKPSVWLLLKSLGFPIQTELPQNRTLLMWAAASLNYDLIDHLLLAGASINAQDKYGWSALHYAASPFREATFDSIGVCVQRLVKGGANVDMLDRLHRTPLMLAIDKDHPALNPGITSRWGADLRMRFVKAFLDNSGREDMEPNASNSVLPHAIASDCPPEIIELLCKHGAALDVKDADGLTPLTLALLGPRAEAVTSILLQHGADPNMMNDKPVNPFEVGQPPTPLLVAIDNGCPPGIVSALLAYGAYPGLGTHLGCTASGLAEKRGMPLAPLLEAAKAAPTPMNRSWLQRVYELPSSVVRT